MFYDRHITDNLIDSQKTFPSVLVTGPRQVGKTTIIKHLYPNIKFVSLDSNATKTAAQEDPAGFLQLQGTPLILDEVQKVPELFSEIKAVIDNSVTPGGRSNGIYFLTGSQNMLLLKNTSETLAGRINIIHMLGLSTREINHDKDKSPFLPVFDFLSKRKPDFKLKGEVLWYRIHRGSMPECWANCEVSWEKFYDSYVQTYLERDVRDFSKIKDLFTFRKFMVAVAARTGHLLNMADIARDTGIDQTTVKTWLSILQASDLVHILEPFSMNVVKRIIKTPKIYFTDTGLACFLSRWTTPEALMNGAMAGNMFETYVFGEILKSYYNAGKKTEIYFYRDSNNAEVDFLLYENNTLYPIEVKKNSNPDKSDAKHFKTLAGAFPTLTIGQGGIVCTGSELLPVQKDVITIPVEYL